ncbi:MAG TPA: DNA alkylation repair protein, partial [Bacteroidales bacterium]|nr:DNA alkylation repair protein [Bacteroidales bacterium]
MKRDIVYEIRLALQSNASEEVRKVSSRFFKPGEQAKVYGVRSQQT